MPVEFDPMRPIYLQIMEAVKKSAVRGIHAPGVQQPSVRDMSTTMGVNPNTMARAYQELEREGFIETRRGEGSFVTREPGRIDDERRRLTAAACQQFSEQILDLGLTSSQLQVLLERIDKEVKAR